MNPWTHSSDEFLRTRRHAGAQPSILPLGEPIHREQTFSRPRNELFAHLVEHWGHRSIAIETSYPRGVRLDAQLRNEPASPQDDTASLDEAIEHGFSHGFGDSRRTVNWSVG